MKRCLVFVIAVCSMGSSLPTLKYRALSSTGVPLSGAKLYFYETGTTTPLATYSDEALTSANANPVVSDAYGWFGEIYLKTDEAYRVKLTTSADVTQWTLDGINAAQLTSTSIDTRLKQVASNPLDYGAVGDGVADETAYVQSAITNASEVVDLLGKTYRCDNTLTVPSNRIIRNGTLDFSNSAENSYITLIGSAAAEVTLDGDSGINAVLFSPTNVSTFSTGDWIYVESSVGWSGSSITAGEIFYVTKISSDDLYIDRRPGIAYTAATAAGIQKLTMVDNVTLENLTITGSTVASGSGNFIVGKYVSRLRINDLRVTGAKGAAITLEYAAMVDISGVHVDESDVTTSCGVKVLDGSYKVTISDSVFRSLEDGIYATAEIADNDGLIEDLRILRNTFGDVDQPIEIEKTVFGVEISENKLSGSVGDSIECDSQRVTIRDNVVLRSHDIAIKIQPYVHTADAADRDDWVIVSDNIIHDSVDDGININLDKDGGNLDELIVSGNTINAPEDAGIYIRPDDHTHVLIDNNKIQSCTGHGVFVAGGTGTQADVGEWVISNNQIHDVGTAFSGIYFSQYTANNIVSSRIVNNRITGTMTKGIYADGDASGIVIDGNTVIGTSTTLEYGIEVKDFNGPEIHISNNQVKEVNHASGIGIFINNSSAFGIATTPYVMMSNNTVGVTNLGIKIDLAAVATTETIMTGNRVLSSGSGVLIESTVSSDDYVIANNYISAADAASEYTLQITGTASRISISGNQFARLDDDDHNILLSGAGAGTLTQISIVGNFFHNGDYAIGEGTDANSTNIVAFGNYEDSILTGFSEFVVNTVHIQDSGSVLMGNTPQADGTYAPGASGLKLWGTGAGLTPPYIGTAVPAEPFACDAAHKFAEVWVEDTDDTAYPRKCVCLNLDGTGYDWRTVEDPTATACPFF